MVRENILFVTGRLAEHSLRRVVSALAESVGFDYEVEVLGISVAALMHPEWVQRKLHVLGRYDRIVVPGWCEGTLESLAEQVGTPCQQGPKDLFDLPEFFGQGGRPTEPLSEHAIEIIAEINHAPRLANNQVLAQAKQLQAAGADVIDLGCIPGETWERSGAVTRMLVERGFRVSIDSFAREEVEAAVASGAELVLSCNGGNVSWLRNLGAEVVVIPDDPHDLRTIEPTIEQLEASGTPYRIDSVLEPVGFGFAESLKRYFAVRRQRPDASMMMGVGNLTELSEVDSAGVNFLLAGVCAELSIHSVLTTQVINWARSSVRELDCARKLVHHSVTKHVLPKDLDSSLVMLRDSRLRELGDEALELLASQLTDPNFRLFAEGGRVHLMNRDGHWVGTDPYELFDRMMADSRKSGARPIDAEHAFYLGYEFSKAMTSLQLDKQYRQDEPLDWGFLTSEEPSTLKRRAHRSSSDDRSESTS